MSIEIILIFSIMGAALVLFFTGWVRMDIVALLVLGTLAITGLVDPYEALSGFSNPAVVTVWAMFILSAALYQTGVAKIIGRQVLRFAGNSEWRIIAVIMVTTGSLSAVMNNIGVAALMLPVVMDISRTTGRSPSRLLMPLAYGSLLGGLTTLIGTPPNLLVSFALQDAGLRPFGLFDFTPVGLGVMIGGIIFVAAIGRHLLPSGKNLKKEKKKQKKELTASYDLQERTFLIKINPGTWLEGKTLAESRMRPALGLNVLSVKRHGGGTILDPGPDTIIRGNDRLFVQGRYEAIKALRKWKILLPEQKGLDLTGRDLTILDFFEATMDEKSPLIGKKPGSLQGTDDYNINILAIKRDDIVVSGNINKEEILPNDVLFCQGSQDTMDMLVEKNILIHYRKADQENLQKIYKLHENLFVLEIEEDSELFEKAGPDTQLGQAFGFKVLAIIRGENEFVIPKTGEKFLPGDHLLVQGNIDDLPLLRGLMEMELLDDKAPETQSLEKDDVIMAEIVLAPRSLMAGKTLSEINFRKKYGLTVLALWREGRAYRTNLHTIPLRFGEALLLYGKREKMELIGTEPDFIMLTDTLPQTFRTNKALTATLVMAAILAPVLLGLIPLAISALFGITLMVLTGCLKMEEAYRAIEWRSVFLIAGLLPLGAAMQQSGAAAMLAQGVVDLFGVYGPWGVLIGLYLLTLLCTIAIPPAALIVIMAPIVLQAAEGFGISPHSLLMAVSIAAAGSFLSPVSHPANLLVMGPGGYKFTDYIKLGLPLSMVVMVIVMLLLPIFWPF